MEAENVFYFGESTDTDKDRQLADDVLFQEAIRITVEINTQYHTPEELRELMSRLTGRRVDDTFRLFPPFYTDFGKNIIMGKDVFLYCNQ